MKILSFLPYFSLVTFISGLPQRDSYDDNFPETFVTPALVQYTKLSDDQVKHLQTKGFGPTTITFKATTPLHSEDEDDIIPSSSQTVQSRTPSYDEKYLLRNNIPSVQRPRNYPQAQAYVLRRPISEPRQQIVEESRNPKDKNEKEEEEEPDRLTLLLPQSRFHCDGKSGYYADESLGCEVFHYCHDNVKHSWICPDGFTFHQVHLICMPPGADNICDKSAQYHFVNEYLYKPINLEEHQRKPNITLKYSDRYYPENFYQHIAEEEEQQETRQKQPIRIALQQAPAPRAIRKQNQNTAETTQQGQVFRSPEEINISLQHRKPAYVSQRYETSY